MAPAAAKVGRFSSVDAGGRSEDLTALPLPSERMRIRWPPRRRHHRAEKPSEDEEEERDERHWVDQRQFKTIAPPETASQKKLPTLTPRVRPLGNSRLVVRSPAAHWIGADHAAWRPAP